VNGTVIKLTTALLAIAFLGNCSRSSPFCVAQEHSTSLQRWFGAAVVSEPQNPDGTVRASHIFWTAHLEPMMSAFKKQSRKKKDTNCFPCT